MSSKLYVFFEYLYVLMAVFSIYLVVSNWESDRNRAYLFGFFAVVAIFMFFFKRKFRKTIEQRRNDNNNPS